MLFEAMIRLDRVIDMLNVEIEFAKEEKDELKMWTIDRMLMQLYLTRQLIEKAEPMEK